MRKHEQSKALRDLVSRPPERFELPAGRRVDGIVEAPVYRLRSGKDRAVLLRPVANRDDEVERLADELLKVLRSLA